MLFLLAGHTQDFESVNVNPLPQSSCHLVSTSDSRAKSKDLLSLPLQLCCICSFPIYGSPVYSASAPPRNKDTLFLGFKWSYPSCPYSFPWLSSSCQWFNSPHSLSLKLSGISYKHFKIVIIRAAHYFPCHSDYQTGNESSSLPYRTTFNFRISKSSIL